MQGTTNVPLFSLGQIVATPGALAALEKAGQPPQQFLARHVLGDWGDLDEEDRKENELSLKRGFRLLSSYRTNAGDTRVLGSVVSPPSEMDRCGFQSANAYGEPKVLA